MLGLGARFKSLYYNHNHLKRFIYLNFCLYRYFARMHVCVQCSWGPEESLFLPFSLFLPPCLPPPSLLYLCCLFLCLFLKMFYSYLTITHLNMFSKIQLVSKQPSLVILHNNVRIKSLFLSFLDKFYS